MDILAAARAELERNMDEKTRDGARRFFKEEVKFYGVKSAVVQRIAKKYYREIKGRPKEEVFALCEALFRSGYGEEAFIASEWAYSRREDYRPEDFARFARWVKDYVDNWAKCDTLCNHAVGAFVEMYPEYAVELKRWAKSKNRWERRAAAVTLILPARKGLFLKEALEIADILLMDADDLVQKGYGWLLKEASKARLAEVFAFIMERKDRMPRTALRYALEKTPEDMRKKAMARTTPG